MGVGENSSALDLHYQMTQFTFMFSIYYQSVRYTVLLVGKTVRSTFLKRCLAKLVGIDFAEAPLNSQCITKD